MIDHTDFNPRQELPFPAQVSPGRECAPASFQWKLWIYTNYDCNLRCAYCVAKSSPDAPRRAIGLANVERLVDEAVDLGFCEIFLTGGEPFILPDIYAMIAYSSQRVKTSVLTNAMLFNASRLDRLAAVASERLTVQVSLDGARPEQHDAYRGQGTWEKTVAGLNLLLERGLHLRISTTETPANRDHLGEICELHRSLRISEGDHLLRPLARRGFSEDGIDIAMKDILPEVTANVDGIFWHPLSTDSDMQISRSLFPLSGAVKTIQEQLEVIAQGGEPLITFT